jgi:hypothetical protein
MIDLQDLLRLSRPEIGARPSDLMATSEYSLSDHLHIHHVRSAGAVQRYSRRWAACEKAIRPNLCDAPSDNREKRR